MDTLLLVFINNGAVYLGKKYYLYLLQKPNTSQPHTRQRTRKLCGFALLFCNYSDIYSAQLWALLRERRYIVLWIFEIGREKANTWHQTLKLKPSSSHGCGAATDTEKFGKMKSSPE
jgi:hypothetical protein